MELIEEVNRSLKQKHQALEQHQRTNKKAHQLVGQCEMLLSIKSLLSIVLAVTRSQNVYACSRVRLERDNNVKA